MVMSTFCFTLCWIWLSTMKGVELLKYHQNTLPEKFTEVTKSEGFNIAS